MAQPLVIIIEPFQGHRAIYNAFFGNVFLLGPTNTPYIDSAIALLALGYDPARRLLMRRRGVNVNQLEYLLGFAAQLEVETQANRPSHPILQQDGPGAVP